ncbi:dephospho-CoA kinase [Bryobacter aggregatus]|uniref:dephospho-CoA kinase n=1 Tax=Bryobacter aggregatus TaxID=360054 RepID=UPI0004E0EDCB|nr:dephospho-CoA kinase [Bryobacter aggregatus]
MIQVGLTGGMATGKSLVGQELVRLGCHLLKADELGHKLLESGGACYDAVVGAFGRAILDANENIERRRLAMVVFNEGGALEKLNSIIHPAVFSYEAEWLRQVGEEEEGQAIAVVEAAILIETGNYKNFDKLIVTWCPEDMMVERAMARGGWSREEARRRIAKQMPADEKKKYADYVIDTSDTLESTLEQTRAVYSALRSLTL